MESLKAMFPALDSATLMAALEAHGGNVERTVEYLLGEREGGDVRSWGPAAGGERGPMGAGEETGTMMPSVMYDSGDPVADRIRRQQLEEDERLAMQLQMEEQYTQEGNVNERGERDASWQVPSMRDVQDSIAPVVETIKVAGRATWLKIQDLYHTYVEETPESNQRVSRRIRSASFVEPERARLYLIRPTLLSCLG
mmetsp:Transcript_9254/g.18849  ORF Transcript_9254/g.18849 Transcript_9254/m.18849 type:complete len:197 (-) Transcript_9254:351-941(-)